MISPAIALVDLPKSIGREIDILITCASYESRCLSIPRELAASVSGSSLVVVHENLAAQIAAHRETLVSLLRGTPVLAAVDSTDPIKTADALALAFSEIFARQSKSNRTVFVDITTFTHETLLILLRTLQSHLTGGDKTLLGYAGAADYDPGHDDASKWLSVGVEDMRSVLGFSGRILPSRKSHLVVLVGFEHERAAALIESFEPNRLSLGYGKPGTFTGPKHEAANRRFHHLLSSMVAKSASVESFEFACNDPWAARDAVLERGNRYPDCNVIVAPMNTKVSTVGCALAAFKNDGIQLCYAQPASYNYSNYSSPGPHCYCWDLSADLCSVIGVT